jgi:hypothetical protein
MNMPIFPYDGVGPIKLGMTHAEIRTVIGGKYRTFMKGPFAKMATDDFMVKGIHVHYKAPGICEAIELFSPTNPTFRGHRLMGVPFNEISKSILEEDPAAQVEGDGLTSFRFGFNLYVPELDDGPESPVKAVLVFEKGYYGESQTQ